jgi:hypothetical protein
MGSRIRPSVYDWTASSRSFALLDENRSDDPYERLLRVQFAEGKFDASTFQQLLAAYQHQKGPSA